MTNTCLRMTKINDTMYLIVRYASSKILIRVVFEQIWIILIKFFTSEKNFLLSCKLHWKGIFLVTRKLAMSVNHVITEIFKICSSWKLSLIGEVLKDSSQTSLDKWSATTFSTPFLSRMVMSNSWRRRIHLINLGLASCLERRYFKPAWSLKDNNILSNKVRSEFFQCKNYCK